MECIYTSTGKQRAVFTGGKTNRFDLQGAPSGSVVEWTDEPVGANRHQQIFSFTPMLETSGVISGATAIRVRVAEGMTGHCVLTVTEVEDDPDAELIGALVKFNSQLAAVNGDLRVVAALV